MRQEHFGQSGPSHMCLAQSVVLSRRRQWRDGSSLVGCHVTSTFLHPFAPPALPGFLATMGALTPERSALRILIRDNELRPGIRSGLLASCIKPSHRSASNHLLSSPGSSLVSIPELTARSADRIPCEDLGVVWASPLSRRLATTTGRIEFVILRTSGSPPVALHPLSRGRSYFRLQGSDQT